nr:MAG TPA: hypothetical protein [Bacteriophage sp.]DAS48232.1 MAG TPA: hypothetical protein [Caudoviricetes sp.]
MLLYGVILLYINNFSRNTLDILFNTYRRGLYGSREYI